MRLSKSDFAGTKSVYRFTLWQMLKNRANLISAVILILLSALLFPLGGVFGSALTEDEVEAVEMKAVYLTFESSVTFSAQTLSQKDPAFAQVSFFAQPPATLSNQEVHAHIRENGVEGYQITLTCAEDTDVPRQALQQLYQLLSQSLMEARIAQSGATSDQLAVAGADLTVQATDYKTYTQGAFDEEAFLLRYAVQYAYAMIVMMLCMICASYIIRAVIDEKSSRLVELLMTSVSALALIVGKVLAVMTYVFGLLATVVGVGFASAQITGAVTKKNVLQSLFSSFGLSTEALRISPLAVVTIVIGLLLAYLTVSVIAALSGSACSRTEEADSANTVTVLLVLFGYVLSIILVAFDHPVLSIVSALLPCVSVFTVPVLYVLHSIPFWVVLLSFAIQCVILWLLCVVCARVYRDMLLYQGNRMKWRQIFSLARSKKRESNQEVAP